MLFELPELEKGLIQELYETVYESLDDTESELNHLMERPADMESVNHIYRNLHSIKGNFYVCYLKPFGDYVYAVEETFSEIRKGRLSFTPLINEVSLGALDKLRTCMEILSHDGSIDTSQMERISNAFLNLAKADKLTSEASADEVLQVLMGTVDTGIAAALELPESDATLSAPISTRDLDDDLKYFQSLAYLLDSRIPYWGGRIQKLIGITSVVMPFLPYKLDRVQMHAAVYVHDAGMAYLPDEILLSTGNLDDLQRQAIESHLHVGYQMLKRLDAWESAALMVYQHHEHEDGSGYPNEHVGDEICNGARLLAVADAFCSLTCNRADRPRRRTVLRALMEINGHSGTQFHEPTVKAFTEMASVMYRSG